MARDRPRSTVVCSCGQKVKEVGLQQHVRDSPKHPAHERPVNLGTATIANSQEIGQRRDKSYRRTGPIIVTDAMEIMVTSTGDAFCSCGEAMKVDVYDKHRCRSDGEVVCGCGERMTLVSFLFYHACLAHRLSSPIYPSEDKGTGVKSKGLLARKAQHTVICTCGKSIKKVGLANHLKASKLHQQEEPHPKRKQRTGKSFTSGGQQQQRDKLGDAGTGASRHFLSSFVDGVYNPFPETNNRNSAGQRQRQQSRIQLKRDFDSNFTDSLSESDIASDYTNNFSYPDIGFNHGLCDKDCGWCGHCADDLDI